MNSASGYVYVLTNPMFVSEWVRIIKSEDDPDVLLSKLQFGDLPKSFVITASAKCERYKEVFKIVERTFNKCKVKCQNGDFGFYNVNPTEVIETLKDIQSISSDIEIKVDESTLMESVQRLESSKKKTVKRVLSNKRQRRSPFKFSMIGLKSGDDLMFIPTGEVVQIASDDEVEYKGFLYKLSPFVEKFLPDHLRNKSDQYQGAAYFTFNGELLTILRMKAEAQAEHLA